MKRLIAKLTVTSVLIVLSPAGLLAADSGGAGQGGSTSSKPGQGFSLTLPKGAVPGSTPERRAALRRLTPEQRRDYVRSAAGLAPRSAAGQPGDPVSAQPILVRPDLFGQAVRGTVEAAPPAGGLSFSSRAPKALEKIVYSGADNDLDGLPDDFESAVGDAFTPLYGVSGGEQAGTGFARFGNYTPQTVIQNLPVVPPASHYRVTPVGFSYDSTGRQFGFLQIDYLTTWNRDDGLQISGDCRFYASVLGGLIGYGLSSALDGLQSHAIDDERSAVLVAAPTPSPYAYSRDPATYQAYSYYTAAHEATLFDHSTYLSPSAPVPANNHLILYLSRAKHGTYSFNPDGFPLFPDWIIATTYFTLDDLYFNYYIDDYDYLIYSGMADVLFYSCVVEHFQNQGGWYSSPRINLGELSHPLNGSGFIYDSRVQSKLTPLLWTVH